LELLKKVRLKGNFNEMIGDFAEDRDSFNRIKTRKMRTFAIELRNSYYKPNQIEKRIKNIDDNEKFATNEIDVK